MPESKSDVSPSPPTFVGPPVPRTFREYLASFGPGIDTDALLRRAIAHGVVFVPGSAFYVEARHLDRARLSFSAPPPAQIEAAVSRLAGAVREELEVRERSGSGPSADWAGARTASEGPPRE